MNTTVENPDRKPASHDLQCPFPRAPRRTIASGGSAVVTQCQICGHDDLRSFLFLGYLPPVNTMPLVGSAPAEQAAYPAQLLQCPRCQLVQLGVVVDPQILFPPEYPYTSGTTRILRENFAELYRESSELLNLEPEDLIVDVGSNDGTLLSNFAPHHRVHGIEPSNQGHLAVKRGIPTLVSFFNSQSARAVRSSSGPAKVITATNVFAHIEDVHGIVENILLLLDEDGVFISESHYLHSLIETLQYDTIYHEHLRYYSLQSLSYLLEMHGLEVFHARRISTHGGSIRVYAARKGTRPIRSSVEQILAAETTTNLNNDSLDLFRQRVVRSKLSLLVLLANLKSANARIYAVGAPSRASTLVNFVGLDDGIVDCVLEIKGSHKIGKYLPGTMIPVENEEKLFVDQPEYALLLSWHIADELIPKLRARGFQGRFIIPLPEPRIVEAGSNETTRRTDPLVSLIVCVKNGMPYLPQAMESVLAQTYRNFELIVQDARSDDGSLEYFRSLISCVHLDIVSEEDGGIGDAYNRALRRCRGEIIGSIDADNLMESDALEHVVRYFQMHPQTAVVYGASHSISADGKRLSTWVPPEFEAAKLARCEVVPPFGQSFFSRSICGPEFRFETSMKTCADYDLWLRLSGLQITRLDNVLGSVRQSVKSMSCLPTNYDQLVSDKIEAYKRDLQRRSLPAEGAAFDADLGGIYAWAAESLYNLAPTSIEFATYFALARKLAPNSRIVARVGKAVQNNDPEFTKAPANAAASGHANQSNEQGSACTPSDSELFARQKLEIGRMLRREGAISDEEMSQANCCLNELINSPDVTGWAKSNWKTIPPTVAPLIVHHIGELRASGEDEAACVLEMLYGLITKPLEFLRETPSLDFRLPVIRALKSGAGNSSRQHPVIEAVTCWKGFVPRGFEADFLGTLTRSETFVQVDGLPDAAYVRTTHPKMQGEYPQYVDLLESINLAQHTFTMIELGAGYGRGLVRAAAYLRRARPALEFRLIGVEAEPQHFRWMKQHFQDNGLNPDEHTLIQAAVAARSGQAKFHARKPGEWYGQAIISYTGQDVLKVPTVDLGSLLEPLQVVDLIDIDVQGVEAEVLSTARDLLPGKVRRIHVGTHSAEIEAELRRLFHQLGWVCLNDFPCRSRSETAYGPIEFQDGVQTWLNPAIPSRSTPIAAAHPLKNPVQLSAQ